MWVEGDGTGVIEGTPRQLSRMIGADSVDQVERIVDEMKEAGIGRVKRTGNVIRFESGRMREEWETSCKKMQKKRKRDRKYQQEKSALEDQKRIIVDDNESKSEREMNDPSLSLSSSKSLSSSESDKEEKVSNSFGDAVRIFVKHTRWEPPNMYADQIQHRVKDLDVWESVVIAWVAEGYRKTSVIKMIEKYEQERIEVKKAKGGKAAMCPRCKKNRLHPAYGICVSCVEVAEKEKDTRKMEATVTRKDQFSPPIKTGTA
jgi:hypothetical protein